MPDARDAVPVLVTGGAGYIGSHTCKLLAQSGYLPVTFDNLVYGHEEAVRWGPLERGELLDGERLDAVLAHYRPRAVIHFAAYAYVGESVVDPLKYYENNVAGTVRLLQAMRDAGIDRLVFSSTCATYGVPQGGAIGEQHAQRPVNPYGHSKLMIEQILRDCAQAHGLRSLALRYFNAAGADPDGETGEGHDPETHLIPLVLAAALDAQAPVTVFGTDYPTSDGTCIRDYIHVMDLARAHVLGLDYLERAPGAAAFNLGTGRGHSVRQVIEAVQRVTGRSVAVRYGPRRPGDPPALVADPSRAGAQLGWRAKWNDLDAIIATAWRWRQRASAEDSGATSTFAESGSRSDLPPA